MGETLRPDERRRLDAALREHRRTRRTHRYLVHRAKAERVRAPSLIDVELGPAQSSVIELPANRSVLVLGEAGHGKTTVALHRLARLWGISNEPLRAAVIVPTEGLARLLQPLLRRLGVDVTATTYERWASVQARRAFRDLPRRESEDATSGVMRMKRDPALRVALAELAREPAGRIDDDRDARVSRSKTLARRADLQHLFGDSILMRRVAAASKEPIADRVVEELLAHTRIQFGKPTEVEFAHVVDRERLVAVDGRPLDRGTAYGDVRTVDTEDYAVMFELDRMRARAIGGLATEPAPFDLIMLDEAQELAPLELALIGRSLAPDGTLIVAGDEAQQVDPTVTFQDWPTAMHELGCVDYERVTLPVGYRCPPDVVALARQVIDPKARPLARDVAIPLAIRFEEDWALAACLIDELSALAEKDSRASAAVLCRSPLTARKLARLLRHGLPCRLVFDGRFTSRGIQITTVDQVRGLEFDYVLIPDADDQTYGLDLPSRRNLYVALTRARRQALFLHTGSSSPLLDPRADSSPA